MMQLPSVVLCLSVVLFTTGLARASEQPRRLVSLIDYIGADYRNAVQEGKVVNRDEYQEMEEFSARALEIVAQLKAGAAGDQAGIEPSVKTLAAMIREMQDEKPIQDLVRSIREKLISAYGIVTYPNTIPSLESGRSVYGEYCAQCHGASGKGGGPRRADMRPKEPAPANFTDQEVMANLSPFRAFNTVSFGVQGTAMADFSALPEALRWQVAYYVHSLRFTPEAAAKGELLFQSGKFPAELTASANLSTSSDGRLRDQLKRYAATDSQADDGLAYLRRGLLEKKQPDPLAVAATLLREAVKLYAGGDRDGAYRKAMEAYLDGFELAEPALFAKDNSLGRSLEAQFTRFRAAVRRGDPTEEIEKLQREIESGLNDASTLLAPEHRLSNYYLFFNSGLIILREGLEAALILAAILSLLRVIGAREAIRYIHFGWILALVAGFLTWVSAQTILDLSGSHRETMEGITTLTAAAVLFYVGYWLHTKSEAEKWRVFIQDKVQGVLPNRNVWALIGVSFFAVYREAFEVVLFYQALWLQSENGREPVLWGFISGVLTLIISAYAIFKLGLKIPVKYFFGATGLLLYFLAFIFAGQGVNELQTAGWASITALDFPPTVQFLGIYPTLETLAAQGVMLIALLGSMIRLSGQNRKAK